MEDFVGTPQCPHLGFDLKGGRPCCHADGATRIACGKFVPNPEARKAAGREQYGVEEYFCAVLGTDTLPAEALRLGELDKRRARQESRDAPGQPRFRPPAQAQGRVEALPDRSQSADPDADPVIPTHTLKKHDERRAAPNSPCPCGSGKKYKKCCGR